jgi:hypothetical protein
VPRHVARLVAWLIVDYFASRRLVVDYFAYAARPGASARRTARRRLLRLRRASGCFGTSRGSSHGSSSTTSPTPARPGASARRAARYTARRRLLVCRDFILRPHWLYFSHVVRHDYLSRGNTGSTSTTPRTRDVIFWSHRVDHSSRLVFQTSRERQSRPQQLVGINSD